MRRLRTLVLLLLATSATQAVALEYDWNDTHFTLNNRYTFGAAIRMQERDYRLIGKTNVPGQQDLCSKDSCISLTGDPEPNQRLVDARGAYGGVNGDNGDINYSQYDLVAASSRLSSDLKVTYGDWLMRVRGIAFYDPINDGFNEHHYDQRFQPSSTPRSSQVEGVYARGVDLYDGYVQSRFDVGDREAVLSVGYQTIRWGESTLIARNAIAEINAPNSAVLHTAGHEINDILRAQDRKRVVTGKNETVRVTPGGRRILKKKKKK